MSDVRNFIPSLFTPDRPASRADGSNYVSSQQPGCGVVVYPNGSSKRPVRRLFYEIQACSVDRTITDIGGSFSMTLLGTEPWEDAIRPGDYVRIFMGDQVVGGNLATAYNIAEGRISLDPDKEVLGSDSLGLMYVPLPGSTKATTPINYLAMYERFVGKVDRIERSVSSPNQQGGAVVTYQVSGRFLGALIQDISLYYNEWLPGLNAINVFFDSSIGIFGGPHEFVKKMLSVVLSAVPMPQFILPEKFLQSMTFSEVATENAEYAKVALEGFLRRIKGSEQSPSGETANMLAKLNRLMSEIESSGRKTPFNIISTRGIKECYGSTLNNSYLNSTTTGLFDMIKHLSNDVFNEFFMDLCPNGDPSNGTALSGTPVPTFVLRQRPYNVTDSMLASTAPYVFEGKEKIKDFQPVKLEGISSSLEDHLHSAISIFGPMQNADLVQISKTQKASSNLIRLFMSDTNSPTLLDYQVGLSDHDRLNAFLCLGNYGRGQGSSDADRIQLSTNGGFGVDVDSIAAYGFRIMETSTMYAQPNNGKNKLTDWVSILTNFSKTLSNWYFMNPNFLNGRMVCRFLPEARLGVPCKYFETRITPTNPVPKMELSYVQGVTDNFVAGQALTTTLTVIRGIRYHLTDDLAIQKDQALQSLNLINNRVSNIFTGEIA